MARSLCLPDFSLNWVMRSSQPSRATQLKIQASSACSGTWPWLKIGERCGIDAGGDIGRRDFAGGARQLVRLAVAGILR